MIRGVLLDVDGTLVESNRAHAEAWHEAFVEAGLEAPPVTEIERLIGMGGDKLLPAAVGLTEASPVGGRLSERRGELFRDRWLPGLRAAPGADRLVAALRERGLRLAIATSAKPQELRGLLERAGVPAELAEVAVSAEDVAASKPEPDVVEAALRQIGLPAGEVLLVGDTPYDVTAGSRAGVGVVTVRCGGWSDEELDGAVAVFDDPGHLADHLDEVLSGRGGSGG